MRIAQAMDWSTRTDGWVSVKSQIKAKPNQQKHNILKLKQGKGSVNVMVDFICIGRFELWATRIKQELQNEKNLPTAEQEPTIFRLLDFRLNRLSYRTFWV